MASRKKQNSKKWSEKNTKSKNSSPNPGSDTLRYTGPVRTKSDMEEMHIETVVLGFSFQATSTGAGVLSGVIDNSVGSGTGLAQCTDWASLSNTWGEYRVLAMQLRWFPYNRYSKTTTVCSPGIRVVDRTNNTAISSITDGMQHDSWKIFSLEDPSTHVIKMDGTDEAQWRLTASGVAYAWFKYYSQGLSLTITYGVWYVEYRVQFRSKLN